jgi:hypothetical protein
MRHFVQHDKTRSVAPIPVSLADAVMPARTAVTIHLVFGGDVKGVSTQKAGFAT